LGWSLNVGVALVQGMRRKEASYVLVGYSKEKSTHQLEESASRLSAVMYEEPGDTPNVSKSPHNFSASLLQISL
jgi:hypothetical protein